MRRFVTAVAVAAALVPFSPASADHACNSRVVPPSGPYYVVVDSVSNPHGGVWIYEESNGMEGLQRDDDSCAGDPAIEVYDTVIF